MNTKKPKIETRLTVMASGAGTNFEALVRSSINGKLPAKIVGLITTKKSAGCVERAEALNVPFAVLSPKNYSDFSQWDQACLEQLRKWQTQWVVLAGFSQKIGSQVLAAYAGQIINSHPSLLPKFGGKGMYGSKVHAAVLAAKERETGVTVHLVTEQYDSGPVLAQKRIPVFAHDTTDTLQERVKIFEREFYTKVIADLLSGRISADKPASK